MGANYKIIQRTDFTKKDGSNSICLRLIIDRRIKLYSLNISCFKGILLSIIIISNKDRNINLELRNTHEYMSLLGHEDLRTIRIYAKILNYKKIVTSY